jgi:hypothetical protein
VIRGPLFLAAVSLMMSSPAGVPAPAQAARARNPAEQWRASFASAERYASGRLGRVSFALVDDAGRLHRYHGGRQYHSASVVKAMLLVAYLNRRGVRGHPLSSSARRLLRPMIVYSDNGAASRTRAIVGNAGLARVARRVGMRHFATDANWGNTHIAAADQARLMYRIDGLVPERHRGFALGLLRHVIPPQRWGVPQALPHHSRVFFKGGWRPEGGSWIIHQVALVEHGKRRASLAVLTDHDRSDGYGHETVRGIAKRALLPLGRP